MQCHHVGATAALSSRPWEAVRPFRPSCATCLADPLMGRPGVRGMAAGPRRGLALLRAIARGSERRPEPHASARRGRPVFDPARDRTDLAASPPRTMTKTWRSDALLGRHSARGQAPGVGAWPFIRPVPAEIGAHWRGRGGLRCRIPSPPYRAGKPASTILFAGGPLQVFRLGAPGAKKTRSLGRGPINVHAQFWCADQKPLVFAEGGGFKGAHGRAAGSAGRHKRRVVLSFFRGRISSRRREIINGRSDMVAMLPARSARRAQARA